MINYGIFRKTLSDSFFALWLSVVGLTAFVILFGWAMVNMGQELMEFVSRLGFVKKIMEMSLGVSLDGEVSLTTLFAICFTHGVILTTTWGVLIATATRVTVGEVEKGTADLMLTLPVSRFRVFCSTTLVWALIAIVLSFVPILGIWLSILILQPEESIDISRYVAPAINFACLNLAIASMAAMIGSIYDRRGLAVGTTICIALVSVVLNFLEPFIEVLDSIMFLSFLNYFRPVDVVKDGVFPTTSCLVLLGFVAACWLVGMTVFSRKDIPTA